jgi:putative addiction module killer protein
MPEVRQYETSDGRHPVDAWLESLEPRAAARVTKVLTKIESGLLPDVKPVGEGVHESRIDYGPGYRVYFGVDGKLLIILLAGGDKRTQASDIDTAKARWRDYKARKMKGER